MKRACAAPDGGGAGGESVAQGDGSELAALLAPRPQLRLVPVRHHSPRCAHHLRALMRAFRPTQVLIEGADELNALLPALQHAQARPPLAAYLHATVAPAQGAEDGWRCRCYVPFAAFSPEWVALREAARQGATARFIDQPYAARLGPLERLAHFATAPEPTLADEPARQAPDVLARLIDAGGCRDFDEWWDRHFESGSAAEAAAEHYFAGVLAFSRLLREQGGERGTDAAAGRGDEAETPAQAENAAREDHMAAQVRAALTTGGRCLVVCGGYHVAGIVARLAAPEGAASVGGAASAKGVGEVGAHLIPYSLERLERASGYAAGMPAPGYYQAVWQAWEHGAANPDEAAWPRLAVRLTASLREHGLPASLPDAAEAVQLAHRLAALRACRGGRAELLEALRSALLKDSGDAAPFARWQARLFAGDAYGHLPPNAPVAPLLADVQAFCARHRLPARPAAAQPKTLDRYRSARHRQCSQGLHRLIFLGVPYAELEAGPDFVAGTGLTRVREIWSVAWRVETTVALTEAMRYGASLEEAAVNRLLERLAHGAATPPADWVLAVLVMGLAQVAAPVLDAVERWLDRSHDALALAQASGRLAQAFEARHALGAVGWERLPPLLARCFAHTCLRLPWLGEGDDAQQRAALDALADLHGMVRRAAPWADAAAFHEACAALHAAEAPARVRGAAAGILSMAGAWSTADGEVALRGALALAEVDAAQMGEYLQGWLRVGRGWLLSYPPALRMIGDGVAGWSEAAFLSGLPALRLAFAQLTRGELRQLAERLAGTPMAALAPVALPSAAAVAHSRALAAQVAAVLAPWGLA